MIYTTEYDYKFRPIFSDMDGYGWAHHSRYFVWYENARFSILNQKIHISDATFKKYLFPVSDVYSKYYEPVKFGCELIIHVKLEIDDAVPLLKFHYRMIRSIDGKLMSKGESTHVVTDMNHNILSGPPVEFCRAIKRFKGENECT